MLTLDKFDGHLLRKLAPPVGKLVMAYQEPGSAASIIMQVEGVQSGLPAYLFFADYRTSGKVRRPGEIAHYDISSSSLFVDLSDLAEFCYPSSLDPTKPASVRDTGKFQNGVIFKSKDKMIMPAVELNSKRGYAIDLSTGLAMFDELPPGTFQYFWELRFKEDLGLYDKPIARFAPSSVMDLTGI